MNSADVARVVLRGISLILSILTFRDIIWLIRHKLNGARLWKVPLAILMIVNVFVSAVFMYYSFCKFTLNDNMSIVANGQVLFNSFTLWAIEHFKRLSFEDRL